MGMASYNLHKRELQRDEQDCQEVTAENRKNKIFYRIILFAGSIMQGAFVCGRPLYLLYCNHYYSKNRLQFRGMQFAIIFVNSAFIVSSYMRQGVYTKALSFAKWIRPVGFIGRRFD